VFATVRPDNLASQRVLTKCGFIREGEALDPDDGLVWRMVLPRR
jgi:RimJ/RimL family protein N-acetyltransferase